MENFQVGKTYKNWQGFFKVLSTNEKETQISVDGATPKWVSTVALQRVCINVLAEDRAKEAQKARVHAYAAVVGKDYYLMLGYFIYAYFHVHYATGHHIKFTNWYFKVTGFRPDEFICVSPSDQWGLTSQIDFAPTDDIEFPDYLNPVENKNSPGVITIFNNEFWKKLIEMGFRLGRHQNVAAIRSQIPAEHLAEFDRGMALGNPQTLRACG